MKLYIQCIYNYLRARKNYIQELNISKQNLNI